jgi:hypothetical protein
VTADTRQTTVRGQKDVEHMVGYIACIINLHNKVTIVLDNFRRWLIGG